MPAQLMDGTTVATALLDETRAAAAAFERVAGRKPCLVTVLVGDDPASATYVRMKRRRCEKYGLDSHAGRHHPPA